MISATTALRLKQAGLTWQPALMDFFAILDRDMDDKVFVISDMLVTVDLLQGLQVVSFQGASEWALDSLVTTEAIWLPSEEQLRKLLEAALISEGNINLKLTSHFDSSRCELVFRGHFMTFVNSDACEAYAAALLYILEH